MEESVDADATDLRHGGTPLSVRPGSAQRRVMPLTLWLASLAVGTALFHYLGSGPLAPPPSSPSAWGAWAAERDPLVATVAILRIGVLALAWYLIAASGIGLLARLSRAARLVRIADALTVPMVRRLLQGAVGLTMATAVAAASLPSATALDRSGPGAAVGSSQAAEAGTAVHGPTVTLADSTGGRRREAPKTAEPGEAEIDPGTGRKELDGLEVLRPRPRSGEIILPSVPDAPPKTLTLRPSDDGSPASGSGDTATTDATDRSSAPDQVEGVTADVVHDHLGHGGGGIGERFDHEVRTGESFWSIAEATLVATWRRPPTDSEVHGYWRRLIGANEGRLAVADDPDLIFPGQRFLLPDLPEDPRHAGPQP